MGSPLARIGAIPREGILTAVLAAALTAALTATLSGCAGGGGGGSSSGGQTGNLNVAPTDPWRVSAVEGQTPSEVRHDFLLTNIGQAALDWTASSTQPWVQLSATSGQLQGGGTTTVTAILDTVAIAAMTPGIYSADLEFQDAGSSEPPIDVPVALVVTPQQASLTVTPATGLAASGPSGGPFAPGSQVYTLTNSGNAPFSWDATTSAAWVLLQGPTSGTLAVGASTQITVAIDQSAAASFSVGLHSEQVVFNDSSTSLPVAVRDVSVNVTSSVGWTVFTPSADTRMIFVSSSTGDDANNGLSAGAPKRTIEAGKALLRDGFPDWLLLMKGDSWASGFGGFTTSGRSPIEKQLISSYGTGARPIVPFAFFGQSPTLAHIAVVGIHVTSSQNQNGGLAGFQLINGGAPGPISDFLIEDCMVDHMSMGIYIDGCMNFTIRRNVFADILENGILAGRNVNVLFEENVVDNVGQGPGNGLPPHGVYLNADTNGIQQGWVVRRNVVTRCPATGIMMRCGGEMTDNLVAKTAVGLILGGAGSNGPVNGGVIGTVQQNVVLDGQDIPPQGPGGWNWSYSGPRGWGMDFEDITLSTVQDNLVLHNTNGTGPVPIKLDGTINGNRLFDTVVRHNLVFAWGSSTNLLGLSPTQFRNLTLDDNDLQYTIVVPGWTSQIVWVGSPTLIFDGQIHSSNNRFFSSGAGSNQWFFNGTTFRDFPGFMSDLGDTTSTATQVAYPDPTRDIPTYSTHLGGGGTFADFVSHCRMQSKDTWDPNYTADAANTWIRAGYGR